MSFPTDALSLSKEFDRQLENYNEINNSTLSSTSAELQDKTNALCRGLEQTTFKVSELALFSGNEECDELSTESIKMLLLPALLGFLSFKSIEPNRLDVLRITDIYFKDFIQRCNDYGLTTATIPCDEADSDEEEIQNKSKVKGLDQMNADRIHKIERYKKKKILQEKLDDFKLITKTSDDEAVRNYYLTLIEFNIYEVLDQFSVLQMEKDMLKKVERMKENGENPLQKNVERKPMKPFLITKNDLQKKVYGLGYPSLPMYTVEEFYEQRVKDGIFPGNSDNNHATKETEKDPEAEDIAKEMAEENDDADTRESLRSRDEWRDMHRRGWGNTYNRS